jgi:predicted deacylase
MGDQSMKSLKLLTEFLFLTLFLFLSVSAHADISANRKYKDVTDYLHQLAVKYPKTVQMMNIGFDDEGILIEGVQIGNGPINNLVVATHHGNEYGSTELALGFAESLAQTPIDGQTMFVIPVLNIQGYDIRNRYQRVNGSNIDPNRDYPGPCGTEGPHHMKATLNLANFISQKKIVASATLHTYWPAVMYPWGISTHDLETPYQPQFTEMVNAAASVSHYQVGNSTELLYPADGAFEDYAFWAEGIWSILFEVGRSHNPTVAAMTDMVKTNVPGMRAMFEIAPKVRAEKHDFTGKCDAALRMMDMHIE